MAGYRADDFSSVREYSHIQDQITHEKKLALKVKMPNGESRIVGNLYEKYNSNLVKAAEKTDLRDPRAAKGNREETVADQGRKIESG